MNAVRDKVEPNTLMVPHVLMGRKVSGAKARYSTGTGAAFATSALDLDALVLPRNALPPSLDVPMADIIEFLVETGTRLNLADNVWMQQAADATAAVNPLPRRVIENIYREIPGYFSRQVLEFELENVLGGADIVDGWRAITDPNGRSVQMRAFPARIVHILAGNSPGVTASTITRSALAKSVSLLKLPSNDLFTASAILQTMAEIDPDHPVLRSFSAVYWRGGDSAVERIIYRPQYFDKVVVWGGESAVKNVVKYIGPGLEMIAFDPKVSMSVIGREALATTTKLHEAAALVAEDVQLLNQEACAASRFQFVEGSIEQVDAYCAALAAQLEKDRNYGSARSAPPPADLREELEALSFMEPEYRLFGHADGRGMVVRSAEPVDFHPIGKVVNVIPVSSIGDAANFASPATQTVGVYPFHRKAEIRDALFAAGAQRVVNLGTAHMLTNGLPHDAFLPLHRFVRWVADEG